jgi:outer membrane protein assembly factor BamB
MAWPPHRVWLAALACACAVSGLVGCSGPRIFAECNLPPERTWAVEVTSAGQVRWQTPLPPEKGILGEGTAPLVVGSMAVFSQDDVVYGLRLADGRRAWSWSAEGGIKDVFQWHGLIVVYAAGSHVGLITGLAAATGQVRWTRKTGQALPGYVAVTADGGLVMAVPALEVVNLSDGRVRWTRPDAVPAVLTGPVQPGTPPTMAVSGASVLVAGTTRLTSYDDQTGKVLWSDALTSLLNTTAVRLRASPGVGLWAEAGLAYLTRVQQPNGLFTVVVVGINAVNGQFKRRFGPIAAQSVNVLGPGLVSLESDLGMYWLDDFSPVTGRLRWREPVSGFSTHVRFFAAGHLIAITGPASTSNSEQGLLTAVRSSDGRHVWHVPLPTVVSFPLQPVPGGLLVYAAPVQLPC